MRIIRTIILLTGIGILLPSPPETSNGPDAQQADLGTPSVIGSATMAFADVASFCGRQPGVCQTAGYVAGKLEAKAKYSVKLIYEWASESAGDPQPPLGNQASASDSAAKVATEDGQSTLKPDDLIPAWRAPPKKS